MYRVVEDNSGIPTAAQARCAVIFKFFKGQKSRKFYGESFTCPLFTKDPIFYFSPFFKIPEKN